MMDMSLAESNLDQIRELTYALDEIDYLLPKASDLLEVFMVARTEPVLITDGEKIIFANAQLLELFDADSSVLDLSVKEMIRGFAPNKTVRVRPQHSALQKEALILVRLLRAHNSQPFHIVIARGLDR